MSVYFGSCDYCVTIKEYYFDGKDNCLEDCANCGTNKIRVTRVTVEPYRKVAN